MQLLQDIFIIEQLQVLSEGKTNGPMKIRGIFGRCNEKNNNGRIYPTAVLESQLAKVQPLIAERRLCGELDHPQNDTVKLSNASHLITKLDMKGNDLIGEAEILKTPAGLTAKALVEGGVKIGISSRGMGTLSEDHNGDKIVNEDFRLVTFDLVADPSTRGAFPGLSESTESKFVRDSQSKLKKEGTFVTLLDSKMRDAYQPWIEEDSKKGYPGVKGGTKAARRIEKKIKHNPTCEAFELVKADGHWHRIATTLVEAFADSIKDLENNKQARQNADRVSVADRLHFMRARRSSAKLKKDKRDRIRAAKKRGRRQTDTRTAASGRRSGSRKGASNRREDAGTVYHQKGNLVLENYNADSIALQGRGIGIAASERLRGLRSYRRSVDRDDARNTIRKAKAGVIAKNIEAKGAVKAKDINAKGAAKAKLRATRDQTKLSRVQAQQAQRQSIEKAAVASAKPGSIENIGLGGAARRAGMGAVRKGIDMTRGTARAIRHPIRTGNRLRSFVSRKLGREDQAAAYMQVGYMLAEMFNLIEDTGEAYGKTTKPRGTEGEGAVRIKGKLRVPVGVRGRLRIDPNTGKLGRPDIIKGLANRPNKPGKTQKS